MKAISPSSTKTLGAFLVLLLATVACGGSATPVVATEPPVNTATEPPVSVPPTEPPVQQAGEIIIEAPRSVQFVDTGKCGGRVWKKCTGG